MAALFLAGCGKKSTRQYIHIGPDRLPTKSYERTPEEPFNRSDYVVKLKQMTSFYDVPGEAGYFINGEDYGFDALSFILTETHPGGGPPLHTHDSEESHVVLHGGMGRGPDRQSAIYGGRTLCGARPGRHAAYFSQCRERTV